jgi:hypothetical protein
MSEALDRPQARRIALVEDKADGSDSTRLEVPPATLRLLSQILALMDAQSVARLNERSADSDVLSRLQRTAAAMDAAFPDAEVNFVSVCGT